jgi:outer membrane lipoprotein-sorting protein
MRPFAVSRPRPARWGAAFLALFLSSGAFGAEPTIEELLKSTDDVTRGESSDAVVQMHVKTANYDRTMKMRILAQGKESTLIRILEPAKDAGIATLKVDKNIWNCLPKVDRTIKVPEGMMSGSWMGSHFSNDDLVKESRLSEDFTATLTSRPGDDKDGVYVITLVPKPTAPVVWGSIVATVRPDKMPVSIEYKDEKGVVQRTMRFSDYKTMDGRLVPATFTLIPADKPNEFTSFSYVSLDFDVKVPEGAFTLQALKP